MKILISSVMINQFLRVFCSQGWVEKEEAKLKKSQPFVRNIHFSHIYNLSCKFSRRDEAGDPRPGIF